MKKQINTTLLLIFLFLSSTIWGYETEWQDKILGPTNFKLHGYFWFGYENIDAQKGTVDKETKQGFTMNRAYVRIDGKVTEGDFKGWLYHLTLEGKPGKGDNENVFLKFVYFGIPLPYDLTLIGGLQNTPTTTAGTYSLEKLWAHRYLDEDGKAMWDQLSVTTTSDLGIGLEQTKDFYNFNLLIANGEGFRKSSNARTIQNTTLADLAKGSGDSYGYHLYGRFSLTPLGSKEDLPTRIFIHLPFVLRNFYGIQRTEYEYIDNLNFTTGQFSFLKGDPKAKQDYAYGIEANLFLNMGDMKIGIGAGQIIDKDIRRPAFKIDENLLTTTGITIANFFNYYQPANDSIGIANYLFLWANYQKFGFVARYYINTDDATMAGSLKYREGLSVAEQLIIKDASDNILGNLAPETAAQLIRSGAVDEGKSKMKTILLALEYYMNKRYKMAIGIRQSTTTNKDGSPYKITPFQATNIKNYTSDSFANFLSTQAGFPSNVLTDKDIVGTKRVDKQIFFRSQFTY
jgi:hypothetical protein